jgi:CRISPR-associated protein Cas1
MIKRTLYFGNPAYLSKKNDQLIIRLPEVEKNDTLPETFKKEAQATIPIEDIGVVILDDQRIVITQSLIEGLLENNVALVTCNKSHHPTGLMLNLAGNQLQSAKFQAQVAATQPLVKQLWQQTIKAKITNQAQLLKRQGNEAGNLFRWAADVRSGDPDNLEARAAAYYWKNLFPQIRDFRREREGPPPNNLLNYTYAILRAIVARNLVGSGLLPTLGIHHRNQYNHYCLADDVMEPYRPFADALVVEIIRNGEDFQELGTSVKRQLLGVATVDVLIDGERSPLMVAAQRTTASLARCFEGNSKKLLYPTLPV